MCVYYMPFSLSENPINHVTSVIAPLTAAVVVMAVVTSDQPGQ